MSGASPVPRRPGHAGRSLGVEIAGLSARLLLGGLFVFSGLMKLQDPQMFAFAVKAFHLGFSDRLIGVVAYAVPWTEVIAGVLLVLGLWARASALVMVAAMAVFILAIMSLLVRRLEVDCPCFGSIALFCTGPMGWCHILRNVGLAALASLFVARSMGPFTVGALLARTRADAS